MKWIKRILVLVILLVVFVWGLMFTSENTQQTPLNLVFTTLPEMSISVWVVAGFVVGGILGLSFSLLLLGQLKARQLSLNRQLTRCQQELAQSKNKSVPETV